MKTKGISIPNLPYICQSNRSSQQVKTQNISLPIQTISSSKMVEGYGWDKPKNFDEYINNMIGSYRSELEKMTFTDRRHTSYLVAIKYNADLLWNQYNKQNVDPKLALVNTDVT